MKYFLFSIFIVVTVLTGSASSKEKNKIISYSGLGKIVVFAGLNQVWIQLSDKDEYSNISDRAPFRFKKPQHLTFLTQIYGVEEKFIQSVVNPEKDKQYQIMRVMSSTLIGRAVTMECFDRNDSLGIPICLFKISGKDLGLSLIGEGYSRFITKSTEETELTQVYRRIEESAKEKGLGIWEPYYGLFVTDEL